MMDWPRKRSRSKEMEVPWAYSTKKTRVWLGPRRERICQHKGDQILGKGRRKKNVRIDHRKGRSGPIKELVYIAT